MILIFDDIAIDKIMATQRLINASHRILPWGCHGSEANGRSTVKITTLGSYRPLIDGLWPFQRGCRKMLLKMVFYSNLMGFYSDSMGY